MTTLVDSSLIRILGPVDVRAAQTRSEEIAGSWCVANLDQTLERPPVSNQERVCERAASPRI